VLAALVEIKIRLLTLEKARYNFHEPPQRDVPNVTALPRKEKKWD